MGAQWWVTANSLKDIKFCALSQTAQRVLDGSFWRPIPLYLARARLVF
jgi:hypothetical protein